LKRNIPKHINVQETADYPASEDDNSGDWAIILGIFIPLVIILLFIAAIIFCRQNQKCCWAEKVTGMAACWMSCCGIMMGKDNEHTRVQ